MKRYRKRNPVKQTAPTRGSIEAKKAKYAEKHPEWQYTRESEKVLRKELGH